MSILHTRLNATRPFAHNDVYPTLDEISACKLTLFPVHPELQPRSNTMVPIQPSTARALPLATTSACGKRNSAGGYARYGDVFGKACCTYGFRNSTC